MELLDLTTPSQHDYTDPTVERDVRRLREWLSDLPLMDVTETVRLVTGALDSLNEQKLQAELRFECLEAYRNTAQRLFHTLDPLYLRQLALPKSRRQEAISGLARVFQSLAGGYKLIIKALYGKGGANCALPLLAKALNRALEQLIYALLDSYRFYREVHTALIGELHTLYRAARHCGVLGVSADADDDSVAPATTAMLYHAGMLLSLTDPERLAEGEAGLLFDVLLQHAGHCRVIPGNSWEGSGEGLFLVDLHGEQLPVACTQLQSPVDMKDAYLLDATQALQEIRARLARTPAKVRMQSPEAMLLRRLLPEDDSLSRRGEERCEDGRHVWLLLGLEAIHAHVCRSSAQRSGKQTKGRETRTRCQVLDCSSKGMKLSWDEGVAGDARVGDLLGVLEGEQERESLRLAVIRSIRVYREGGMETGVQLLTGGIGAVSCRLPDKPEGYTVHALFMPAEGQGEVAATLVASKGLYEQGRDMIIDVGGREISVHAGRRVFDSPVFDRFEIAAV